MSGWAAEVEMKKGGKVGSKYYRKEDFGCSKPIICGNVPIMSQRYCPYSPSLPLSLFLKKMRKVHAIFSLWLLCAPASPYTPLLPHRSFRTSLFSEPPSDVEPVVEPLPAEPEPGQTGFIFSKLSLSLVDPPFNITNLLPL